MIYKLIFTRKYTSAVVGTELEFKSIIIGNPISNYWTFGDGASDSDKYITKHSLSAAGKYEVILSVYNLDNPSGVSATVMVHIVSVDNETFYVNKANTAPVPPYKSWSTAATNIQDAVDAAQPNIKGSLILVNNGIYYPSDQISVTEAIIVKSVNGAENTIVDGSHSHRCFSLNDDSIIDGFTITNGYISSGAGVSGGTVNNCIISGNSAGDDGGGTYYSTVNNSTISGNSARYGGGTYYSTVNNSTISGNSARSGGGGSSGSTVNNSTISGNSAGDYGGGGTYYSTVNNCTISGNFAGEEGGGTYRSTVNNCIISGNSAGWNGGGTYEGTVNNSTISGNSASSAGGTYWSTVNNCTISGNSAKYCGGTYKGTVNNCIIWDNYAFNLPNYDYYIIKYSCTTPLPYGEGNISQNPKLIDNAHIATNSPCIGAGSSAFVSGVDIDGDDWAIPPAMGCDQPVDGTCTGKLSVTIFAKYNKITTGYKNYFYGSIIGKASYNEWSFDNGDSWNNTLGGYYSWDNTGAYKVILTAYNDSHPTGIAATTIVEVVEKQTHYADKNSSNPVYPYTDLSTAATNIQEAVDAAIQHGDIVLVNDGVYDTGETVTPGYSCSNRVVITNDITVKSLNGPENTIILGKGPLGDSAVRGVYMSAGILDGFTVSNGHTMTSGDYGFDQFGGGVNMYGGNGVITNCTIDGNSAYRGGGGTFWGTVNNCAISGNSGGGTAYSTANNCIIIGNSGGGTFYGTVNNCTISGNSGGGTEGGTVNNSTISWNSAYEGGGTYGGTVNNCTISENSANEDGGGTYECTVNNCTITENSANLSGGGTYGGTVNNSTINGNSARNYGGGSYANGEFGSINNCIIWDNSAPNDSNLYIDNGRTVKYSCTYPLPPGEGNISNNPQFISSTDFHLQPTSPCINAGTNAYAPMPYDLDGNPRIVNGIVDMGCYEANSTPASPVFADASTLPSDYDSADGSNTNAIIEPGEPAHAGYGPFHSVWWDWKSPSSSMFSMKSNTSGGDVLLVDTHGSDFDTVLAVYTGSVISNLTEIAANDDAGSGTNTSEVIFAFLPDETYHIAVAGKTSSDVGNIVLNYEIIPEPCLFIIYNLLIVIYWRRRK